jgi:hypothetical protein
MEVEYADLAFGEGYLFATAYTHHASLPIMDLSTETEENCRTSAEYRFFYVGSEPPLAWSPQKHAEDQLRSALRANKAEEEAYKQKIEAVQSYSGKAQLNPGWEHHSEKQKEKRGQTAIKEARHLRKSKDDAAVREYRASIDRAYEALRAIEQPEDWPSAMYGDIEDGCHLPPSHEKAERQRSRTVPASMSSKEVDAIVNHAGEDAEPPSAACPELARVTRQYEYQTCSDRSVFVPECKSVAGDAVELKESLCSKAFTTAQNLATWMAKQYRPCFFDVDEGRCRSDRNTVCPEVERDRLREIRLETEQTS